MSESSEYIIGVLVAIVSVLCVVLVNKQRSLQNVIDSTTKLSARVSTLQNDLQRSQSNISALEKENYALKTKLDSLAVTNVRPFYCKLKLK